MKYTDKIQFQKVEELDFFIEELAQAVSESPEIAKLYLQRMGYQMSVQKQAEQKASDASRAPNRPGSSRQYKIENEVDKIGLIGMRRIRIGTKAKTGDSCPEGGIWKVVGHPSTTAPLYSGNTMPLYNGNEVWWLLVQYD